MFGSAELGAAQGASAFGGTAAWIAGILTGTLGGIVAILAIAGVGLAMLQGRLPVRGGMRAVLGCFILFGAPVIARGLADLAVTSSSAMPAEVYSAPPAPPPIEVPPPPQPDRDPYAGASVPM